MASARVIRVGEFCGAIVVELPKPGSDRDSLSICARRDLLLLGEDVCFVAGPLSLGGSQGRS